MIRREWREAVPNQMKYIPLLEVLGMSCMAESVQGKRITVVAKPAYFVIWSDSVPLLPVCKLQTL